MPNYFNTNPYQTFIPQPVEQNNIIVVMVQSEAEAMSYPVAAGNTVLLMAFDSGTFWLKSTDYNRMPMPVRRFTFREVGKEDVAEKNQNGFVTKEEFDELKQLIEDLTK